MDRRSVRHAGVLTCIPVTLVLVALLSLAAPAPAKAAGWEIQLQGQDTWVEHVSAVSGTDAWLIQDDPPKLMHTGDGQYWYDADNTGLTGDLDTVAFATSLVGCVLAHSGKVAYTTDGGANWDIVQTTCSSGEISFADSKNGWMGGLNPRGKLLHTTDGGATWEEQQFETPRPTPSPGSPSWMRRPAGRWSARRPARRYCARRTPASRGRTSLCRRRRRPSCARSRRATPPMPGLAGARTRPVSSWPQPTRE